jgi:PiT family inorganic phosphate transporter
MFAPLLILGAALVALTNGANANFKGVASLYGSGTTTRRVALWWGTIATLAGSVASAFLAQGLLQSFSGKGLVADDVLRTPAFASSVAIGAAATSFLANRFGFPVSTTHALVGALVGAGLVSGDGPVRLEALGKNFFFPLFFSPFVAVVLGAVAYRVLGALGLAPVSRSRSLDAAHFASAGAASFARGLNDTPKIAALLMIVPNLSVPMALMAIGLLIAIGALVDSKHVAETLANKVTAMTPGQGFAANLVTAALVTTASFHGLPVSTTHVSVGSLLGMGASTGQAKWRKVIEILVAWVTTLPIAAAMAMAVAVTLRVVSP